MQQKIKRCCQWHVDVVVAGKKQPRKRLLKELQRDLLRRKQRKEDKYFFLFLFFL
jgi:hypothetical protein